MLDGAFQVIDRRQQILDEILGAVADRLLALAQRAAAEVLEIRLEADQAVLGLDQLGREVLDPSRLGGRFGALAAARALGGRRLGAGGGDGLGGLAQRLLELGAGRQHSPRGFLGEGFPALRHGLRGRELGKVLLSGPIRHAQSFSVITSERYRTSGITRA